jgi:hypothetical protein
MLIIVPLPQKSFAFTPVYNITLSKLSILVTLAGSRLDSNVFGSPASFLSVKLYLAISSLFVFSHPGSTLEVEEQCVKTNKQAAKKLLQIIFLISDALMTAFLCVENEK